MSRILVTGSTDGLGRLTAAGLLDDGHDVVVHARNATRAAIAQDLVGRGAELVVGDLARRDDVLRLADQAVALGPLDAVIHNAGVLDGPAVLPVNVVAPYLLTALVPARRLIYLSSDMHTGGSTRLDGIDWSGRSTATSYSTSKLFVTAFAAAVARLWPDTIASSVDPGWVPTRMGGAHAPGDLALGHDTQRWLATTDEPAALESGGYWHHRRRQQPHSAVYDTDFQAHLLSTLAVETGVSLP